MSLLLTMAPKSFGNWIFEKKLGSGGFGQVELWKEKKTNKRIAIKICTLPSGSITKKHIERWQEEVKNLKILNHINIVKSAPLPSEIHFDGPILCMEYCNGGDLRKFLKKPENSCGLLQNEVLSVMKDISSAICFMHSLPSPITHRDIKPENIVLHKQANGTIIYKLIDLGYAKNIGNKTVTASLVGTFCYVAPELFRTNRYTSSVDYWSLGILFFEVLTGYKPFMPYTEKLAKWMECIEKKQSQEICAREIDGTIVFHHSIIHPTALSDAALNNLVEWFQVALESNSRRRGKSKSSDEIVIFTLLKKIFPWKTISIFSVNSYKNYEIDIDCNTTLLDVQRWIQTESSVCEKEQELVNSSGIILNRIADPAKLLMKDIPDELLYLFKKNCLIHPQIENDEKLPEMIDTLLVNPKDIKQHAQLRQCFTAIIYFMRREVARFKDYIFSVGVKVDVVKNKLHVLDDNVKKSLPRVELLLEGVQTVLASAQCNAMKSHWQGVNDLWSKVKTIHSTVTKMKSEREELSNRVSSEFDNEQLLQSLQIFNEPYEQFLETFKIFDNENQYCSEKIIDKVNELSMIFDEFYEHKAEKLQSTEMDTLVKNLMGFELKLNQLSEGIKSIIKLIPYYETKLSEINNLRAQKLTNLDLNDDTEIKNNIVLRAMLDKRLEELKKSLNQFQIGKNP